jgi:hypothetical protein
MAETVPREWRDVVSVWRPGGPFCSGRLIAPGLVLTAGHAMDEMPAALSATGWFIRFLHPDTADGSDVADEYEAERVWRSSDVDLALLRISNATAAPAPAFDPVFASLEGGAEIDGLDAIGYPQAGWDENRNARDLRVRGSLRIETVQQAGYPLAFTVPIADAPDNVAKWKGMSGAVVIGKDSANAMRVFGAIQRYEETFRNGKLYVAPIAVALADPEFCRLIEQALGRRASVVVVPSPPTERVNDCETAGLLI